MKKLLSLMLALVMLFALAVPAMADGEDGPAPAPDISTYVTDELKDSVVILHSNDVHGAVEGYAKMAALKKLCEEKGAEVIVLDAGDYIQGETAVSVSQGKTAVELMNKVGYTASTIGNHELDYGYENLKTLAESATYKILCANILGEDGKSVFDANMTVDTKVGKLGIFGLNTPETATKAHPAKIKGLTFKGGEDMYKIAEEQVKALKDGGADKVIALAHLGIDDESAANGNRSIDLLEKVTGIDVLIDGHSHSDEATIAAKTNENRTVNGTVITSTGTKFATVGMVVIKADGAITTDAVPAESIPVAEDDEILAAAQAIIAEVKAEYGAAFATSEVVLNGAKAPNGNRDGETNNGDLITDAMLWYATKEDLGVAKENVVALTNGGGIRAAIEIGDVSKEAVNKVLPFGNTVAVDYVTGATLLEALEASTFCTPSAIGGFPQVAGIKFTVNTAIPFDAGENYEGTTYAKPNSIRRVTIQEINGKEFDPEATYAVVTNDFVAAGGDTYFSLKTSDRITDTGVPLDEAVMMYITEVLEGKITAEQYGEPQGRITIIDPLKDFTDVKGDEWFAQAVSLVAFNKVMVGTGENTFEPESNITEATVLQFLYNLDQNMTPEEDKKPADTSKSPWYTDAVAWAKEVKLVEEFTEDKEINRGDTQALMNKFTEMKGLTTDPLFIGSETGDMMLDKTITRMEMAQALSRLMMTAKKK